MTTALPDVIAIIAADLEALSVASDTIDPRPYYYASDERVGPEQQLSHRSFWFPAEEQVRLGVASEDGAGGISYANWRITLKSVFDGDAYSAREYAAALAQEQSRIARCIERRTDWTSGATVSGIWGVETDTIELEKEEGSTAVVIAVRINALIGEDDDVVTVGVAGVAPTITVQPQPSTITIGNAASLSVTATGDATLLYQWHDATSPNANPIGGATASTYAPSPTTTTSYWVAVSNATAPPANSNTAVVTVVAVAPTISVQPAATQTIANGAAASLSVTAVGTGLSYQWYLGSAGDVSTPVGGATASTFAPSPGTGTTNYHVVVTNSGGSIDSNTAAVVVIAQPVITVQPQSQALNAGFAAAGLSITATGASLSYAWYRGASGTTTDPVGTNSSTYAPPVPTVTVSYWCRVTSTGVATVDSAAATITVTAFTSPPPRSFIFDGTGDGIGCADQAIFDGATLMTVSAWLRPTTLGVYRSVISKMAFAAGGNCFEVAKTSVDRIQFYVSGTTSSSADFVISTTALITTAWTHWVGVYDGSLTGNTNRIRHYFNTVLDTAFSNGGTIPAALVSGTTTALRVGLYSAAAPASSFLGRIASPRIWVGQAASQSQVTELYGGGTPMNPLVSTMGQPQFWWAGANPWGGTPDTLPAVINYGSVGAAGDGVAENQTALSTTVPP